MSCDTHVCRTSSPDVNPFAPLVAPLKPARFGLLPTTEARGNRAFTNQAEVSTMALIRWEPVREVESLQQQMNRLFNAVLDPGMSREAGALPSWSPPMDLIEDGDHFVLRADLPGMSEDEISVECEDNVLTVSGERAAEHEGRGEGYRRIERASGRFARSLTLPESVDPDSIQARLEKGVLELTIPRPEERKPRRVSINVGDRPAVIEGGEREGSREGSPEESGVAAGTSA
jgi:HSP20 family protein